MARAAALALILPAPSLRAQIVINRVFIQGSTDASPAAASASPSEKTAVLLWNNQERLAGELVSATTDTLTWKSPLFTEPPEIGLRHLRRVDMPGGASAPDEPFALTMRDGSRLYGEVTEITQKTATLKSKRHGTLAVKREEISSLQRLSGEGIVHSGPVGLAGWAVDASQNSREPTSDAPVLLARKGGTLSTLYWNRSAHRPLDFPGDAKAAADIVDLEFRLRSTSRPEFRIVCRRNVPASGDKGSRQEELAIENWDDEIVLTRDDAYASVLQMDEKEREMQLRVLWDVAAGTALVFSAEGEKLGELAASPPPVAKPAGDSSTKRNITVSSRANTTVLANQLRIENKGPDLSLDFLRVRTRPPGGALPSKLEAGAPRVDLADGSSIAWKVLRAAPEGVTVADATAASRTLAWKEVHGITFHEDPPAHWEETTGLWFADGGFIEGSLRGIEKGVAIVHTRFADGPVSAQLDALRRMDLQLKRAGEPSLDAYDKLSTGGAFLHGTLEATGRTNPNWLLIGAVKSVCINHQREMEIIRHQPVDGKYPRSPALFFLSTGDVLPGTLQQVAGDTLEIESPLSAMRRLPVALLHGVQFAVKEVNPDGFADPRWRVMRGDAKSVRVRGSELSLEPGTAYGHPGILQADEVSFSLGYDSGAGMSALRLKMFTNGSDTASPSTNLLFANYGSQVYGGLESATQPGQMDDQFSLNLSDYGKPATLRLAWVGPQIECFVNGVSMRKMNIADRPRAGFGLVIEPAGLWGNSERPVTLSNFSVRLSPGAIPVPIVNPESKIHALTIPRFRRDDPPKHVLLAENGDLLRGEIEGLTPSHIAFRSGLESIRVPRDRVAAAVWPKKPRPEAVQDAKQLGLRDRVMESLGKSPMPNYGFTNSALRSVISIVQREAAGPTIDLPESLADKQVTVRFRGHSVATALQLICQAAGVSFRVVAEDRIVIEPPPAETQKIVTKVYWLKTDTFTDGKSAVEYLKNHGYTAGEDSAITYEPATALLTIRDAAGAFPRIEKAVDALSGGKPLTPTHYFELASGARFPLAVERFDPQEVIGRHPLAGAMRVPMTHLHAIRTTAPPDQDAALRAFADWELQIAPEPVLPETGGQSSPLLGKQAADFSLPLLAGGQFSLAAEKGKVIVLDFWATWCGPCVKALPELIAEMSALPPDKTRLIAVNQAESPDVVKKFMEARGWKLEVALDARQTAGKQYDADSLPHTVVIGQDGRIAWVKSGYSPSGAKECAAAVSKLLAPQ